MEALRITVESAGTQDPFAVAVCNCSDDELLSRSSSRPTDINWQCESQNYVKKFPDAYIITPQDISEKTRTVEHKLQEQLFVRKSRITPRQGQLNEDNVICLQFEITRRKLTFNKTLYVQIARGPRIPLTVDLEMSVGELFEMVENLTGLPVGKQRV